MNRSLVPLLIVPCLAIFLSACATASRHILIGEGNAVSSRELSATLAENPIKATENLRVSLIRRSDHASMHVVQVRNAEVPHVHKIHDLTVFVVRGHGEMTMGHGTRTVQEGDVIHVPAGMRHYFVNKGSSVAVAVVIFSPPFDGQDTKPVE